MDKIEGTLGLLNGLPLIPKLITSLIVVGIAVVVLFLLWQPLPSAAKPVSASGSVGLPKTLEATSKPKARERGKVVKQAPSKPKSVRIGDVSSTAQSGGVTAGYIGSVDQK